MSERLPDFLVIGAAKAGTTSLVRWLSAHPQVWLPPAKELHFFDREDIWSRGTEWYAAQFAGSDPGVTVGEGTPVYLFAPDVAGRVASVVPQARLIALLRHPVDRAYSHYWHARDWGGEAREFDEVVDIGIAGAETGRSYVARGHYLEQLMRYDAAGLGEQLLVLRFEQLTDRPAEAFAAACRHVGVSRVVPDNVGRAYNTHSRHRSRRLRQLMLRSHAWKRSPRLADRVDRLNTVSGNYPSMDATVRERLLEHYAPHNEQLAAHLDLDLTAWSR